MKPATVDTRPAPTPAGVPLILGTGDVAAILDMKPRKVRYHASRGRFGEVQPWDTSSHRIYTPEAVAAFAAAIGRTPDWSSVTAS